MAFQNLPSVAADPIVPPSSNISYIIKGGKPVEGVIRCMGAKNLVSKLMVAALLSIEKTTLYNVPLIGEVEITINLIKSLGAKVTCLEAGKLEIEAPTLTSYQASLADSRTNRIPILLLSVLLHRCGRAIVPIVGGDDIGKRKVDFHISALEKFGAEVVLCDRSYVATLPQNGLLQGCHINLPYPSVGATETCLLLGVLAKGTSVIQNVAIEPEIVELTHMLQSMGADITLDSNRCLTIRGVSRLNGTTFTAIGDRIEAASWASLACASSGNITIQGVAPSLLDNFLPYYKLAGGDYRVLSADSIEFFRANPNVITDNIIVETDVYPGFSTDYQQPFALILTQTHGKAVIHETVYEQRFGYLQILKKLGAKAEVFQHCLGSKLCRYHGHGYHHSAIIEGPTPLHSIPEPIAVPDIRAGLAYLIAAALAEGETTLVAAEQLERGYGQLDLKLKNTNLSLSRSHSVTS